MIHQPSRKSDAEVLLATYPQQIYGWSRWKKAVKMCQEKFVQKNEKKNVDLVIIGVVDQHLDGICVK